MKKNTLIAVILVPCLLAGSLFIGVITSNNKAIALEESVNVTSSDIEVQEKRREDLIYNLVDTVENYNKYEAKTLKEIVDKRGKQEGISNVTTAISGIAEAYPQLKSDTNYKQLMLELSTTENLISEHRKTYNSSVKNYNRYIRKFPTRIFLNIAGYEEQRFDYLEFNAEENAPQSLFGDKNE